VNFRFHSGVERFAEDTSDSEAYFDWADKTMPLLHARSIGSDEAHLCADRIFLVKRWGCLDVTEAEVVNCILQGKIGLHEMLSICGKQVKNVFVVYGVQRKTKLRSGGRAI